MTPLIIIGAGRSGTNILRDTLTRLPGFATWDCDEINLIWRHGNITMPHDVFGVAEANAVATPYIRRAFEKLQRHTGARVVVEKTCANSLRVPFIEKVLPEARYIFIVRDGRDVALSAAVRWKAAIEPAYLLKKLRYVPPADVPRYGLRFIANRLHQARSSDGRQAVWGPVYPGMKDDARTMPLIEVCARQWMHCVRQSRTAFASMAPAKVLSMRYEDLVCDPAATMERICNWFEPGLARHMPADALSGIHASSLQGWKKKSHLITPGAMAAMQEELRLNGYETAT
jgi:hypothetical protein